MSSATLRERQLEAALERLVKVAELAERILRSGSCPKCKAEPVTPDGDFDEEWALMMCSTEDWLDVHGGVVEAERVLADVQLDRVRPGRQRLVDVNAVRVELDLLESRGLR